MGKKHEKKVPKTPSLNKQPKTPPIECDKTGPAPITNGHWKCKRNECQLKGPGCQATAICTVDGWNTTLVSECFVCEDKPEVVVEGASWQCEAGKCLLVSDDDSKFCSGKMVCGSEGKWTASGIAASGIEPVCCDIPENFAD